MSCIIFKDRLYDDVSAMLTHLPPDLKNLCLEYACYNYCECTADNIWKFDYMLFQIWPSKDAISIILHPSICVEHYWSFHGQQHLIINRYWETHDLKYPDNFWTSLISLDFTNTIKNRYLLHDLTSTRKQIVSQLKRIFTFSDKSVLKRIAKKYVKKRSKLSTWILDQYHNNHEMTTFAFFDFEKVKYDVLHIVSAIQAADLSI